MCHPESHGGAVVHRSGDATNRAAGHDLLRERPDQGGPEHTVSGATSRDACRPPRPPPHELASGTNGSGHRQLVGSATISTSGKFDGRYASPRTAHLALLEDRGRDLLHVGPPRACRRFGRAPHAHVRSSVIGRLGEFRGLAHQREHDRTEHLELLVVAGALVALLEHDTASFHLARMT